MRRTKIVCTLGPSSSTHEVLRRMIESGLDVARLNLSHGSHDDHKAKIELVRQISREMGIAVGVMADLQGPKLRIGDLTGDQILLNENDDVVLVEGSRGSCPCEIPIPYDGVAQLARPDGVVLLDDGLIQLQVTDVKPGAVRCKVVTGGVLKNRKGICFQGVTVDMAPLTDKDRSDIDFCVSNGIDLIAVSFVRSAEDILAVKQILEELGSDAEVVAKIENIQGLANLEEIIEAADAVMIARGDLGIEMPPEDVPVAQRAIIRKCNEVGKPVITATQMLESMKHSPIPTRAEVADVSGAIMQGTDAVMLSGETAVGRYPVAAVRMMTRIITRTERELPYAEMLRSRTVVSGASIADAICHSTCVTAEKLNAAAIISSTNSGSTAKNVAKYRPSSPIIATTPNVRVANRLTLVWGVVPLVVNYSNDTDSIVQSSVDAAVQSGLVSKGDLVALTAGIGSAVPAGTNFLRVHRV